MTYLPRTPEAGGAKLVAYLEADPRRRAVFDNIVARLGTAGKVEALARYYIVRSAFRRDVFRNVLFAVASRVPHWARDCAKAEQGNRAFVASYRDQYNAFRREMRSAPKPAAA